MKTKLLLIALVASAMAAGSAAARSTPRTNATTSMTSARSVSHWGNQRHHRHHRPHSNVFFGIGLGYPYYGFGYPYYGSYPYGYGYYARPRTVIYSDGGLTDDATVAAVQRRLARAGYYHGTIDGVIGSGTRNAIRSYERNHGLAIDGRIDRQLLATMGLA